VKNAKDAVELLENIAQPHYANYAGAGHSPTSRKKTLGTLQLFLYHFIQSGQLKNFHARHQVTGASMVDDVT